MRVVLDANVLVSAAIGRGPSHLIVQAWLRDQPFELVICDRLVGEVRAVLTERPRLRKWISLDVAELYVRTLATTADVQPDPAPGPALTRDPDDDYVIHLARAYDVDLIVSGDADLLEWSEQDPPVIPPAEFRGETESILRVRRQSLGRGWAAGERKVMQNDASQSEVKPQVSKRFCTNVEVTQTSPH
jgi:putative PIN family toxin of toxin-antitoxin system